MLTGRLRTAALAAAVLVIAPAGAAVAVVPAADAAPTAWNGNYSMVTYASQKGGTSVANRQRENDFGATFTLSTSCATGVCIATANGPGSSNPTVPSPARFTWDGEQWKTMYEWVWQCSLGDGGTSQWSPATSFTFYAPQPDGSLRGMWHTDIASGPCRGSVVMPVAAFPA